MATNSLSMYDPCPPGLSSQNGTTCNVATCNSIFVPPAKRTVKPDSDASCSSCDAGFTGINCNLCNGVDSCQNQRRAAGTSDSSNFLSTANETLVCYRQPDTIRTTNVQCNVIHPTVNSVYPGHMVMTLSKTALLDDFAKTGIASYPQTRNSALSQVWLNGIEQFYCQASGCSAKNASTSVAPDAKFGTTAWTCSDLECHCIPGTTMCGSGKLDLSPIINKLNGTLSMPCDYTDPSSAFSSSSSSNATARCSFQGALLNNFLGSQGLPLQDCTFSSCVTQDDLTKFWAGDFDTGAGLADGTKLSGPLIGGLAILGVAVVSIIGLFVLGMLKRKQAAARPIGTGQGPLGLDWNKIHYRIGPSPSRLSKKSFSIDEKGLPMANGHDTGLILHNVGGRLEPGQMMAILGPSGAGKSSLVDILAGRSKHGTVDGQIRFLDHDHHRDPTLTDRSSSRKRIGFVDQDDSLPAYSTVTEALRMAADLSLAENITKQEKQSIVTEVIHQLGLNVVANKRIGDASRRGLSGGERRRVSIGCALVARPRILIADEPLSGLDAFSASRVVSTFRSLANGSQVGSISIIMTVHQPSSEIFHSFDKVMLMTGGRVIYDGLPSDALSWCQGRGESCPMGHNVADHMMKLAFRPDWPVVPSHNSSTEDSGLQGKMENLVSPTSVDFVSTATRYSDAGSTWQQTADNVPCTTFITQLSTLSLRAWNDATRNPAGPIAHIVGSILIGLFTGGCFYQVNLTIAGFQNRVGSMYFLFILLAFAGMSAATCLSNSRALMIRERANGLYSPVAWIISFVLYDAVLLRLIPAVLLSTLLYWMVGLRHDAASFFEFLLISVLFHIVVALYNMILSALISDLSIVILASGLFVLFNIGFGGFLLNLSQLPRVFRWLQWICPMKYALEAVASNELPGLQLSDKLAGLSISTSVSVFSGNLFGFKDGAYYRDLLVLSLGFILGFFLLLTTAVWWRMRERR